MAGAGTPRPNARYLLPGRPTVRDQLGDLSGEDLVDTYDATIAQVRGLVPVLTRTVDALDQHYRSKQALGRGEG